MVLIPLNLDGYLLEWNDGKANQVRTRLTADFTNWENHSDFERAFKKLIQALKAEGSEVEG